MVFGAEGSIMFFTYPRIRHIWYLCGAVAGLLNVTGCATVTAIAESALAPPSICDSLDSFESAALAIKTSNRILLLAPISEQEEWPERMFAMPTADNSIKMALSGLGMKYGITVPTEIDPETGFPRPTSPLYIMIKDRNKMLNKELRKSYVEYFKKHPAVIQCDIEERKPDCANEYAYRNALMAYGTVSGNNEELIRLEQEMEQMAKGFRQCDAWVRRSQEGEVAKAFCKDPVLKDEAFKDMEIRKTKEQLEEDRKIYGKLSKRVYQATVAGADFSAAALTKIAATIIKFPEALRHAPEEIKGWKGAMNISMLLPRIKNVFSALGIYKDNLYLQFTAYKTMYTQIQGNYQVEETIETREALRRIEQLDTLLAATGQRLDRLAAGQDASFSLHEIAAWEKLAAQWPEGMLQDAALHVAAAYQ